MRRYRRPTQESVDATQRKLQSLIQAELRKNNFSQFDKLLLSLQQQDTAAEGAMEKTRLRTLLLSSLDLTRSQRHTQAARHLLDAYLATWPDRLHYARLVAAMDWVADPVRPVVPQVVKMEDVSEGVVAKKGAVDVILYRDFMEEMQRKL